MKELCIKLVNETSLYYNARSEKHLLYSWFLILLPTTAAGDVLCVLDYAACSLGVP